MDEPRPGDVVVIEARGPFVETPPGSDEQIRVDRRGQLAVVESVEFDGAEIEVTTLERFFPDGRGTSENYLFMRTAEARRVGRLVEPPDPREVKFFEGRLRIALAAG